ncbi:hypothetical protein F5Y05DRAFT_345408 [Hypoxylon sp. FL0543]|nr:hypothetical protein F5Y05DRAFT_345408 [Hypoxylon sp. FL0543]
MHRTLYVLVYPSRLFAAHWSFWLPYVNDGDRQSNTGDRIHVTGDRLNGFQYEYIRNYNVSEDDRHPNAFPIALMSETHLIEPSKCGSIIPGGEDPKDAEDITLNAFDKACREVPAPGPSLNKVNRGDGDKPAGGVPKRAEVKDCQWWIKEATSYLVQVGILLPLDEGHEGKSPVLRVDSLPRH